MSATYVIVVRDLVRERVIGPFEAPERASGAALNLFGPLTFGCPDKWHVARLESLEEARS